MMFKEKPINKLYAFALAAVFALTLAGCGGGGGTAQEPEPMPTQTPQEMCEGAGGRWNADETCTSAEALTAERMAAQRSAISTAIGDATTAVNAVDNDSSDAEVTAADTALENARSAIAAADDLSDEEKAANTGTVNALATVLATAKTARMTAMNDAQKAADAAMAATAAKLYAGISAPMGTVGAYATTDRIAGYAGTNDSQIAVQIGTDPAASAATATLSEDKKTTVADNHGWEGKRYTHSVTTGDDKGDMYEAVVYSDVGAPTMGAKFSAQYPDTAAYVTDGVVTVDTTGTDTPASRVAIDSFTQSAGSKTFPLPDPNPSGVQRITEAGSFHGVRGTYTCTPTDAQSTCSATLATKGLTLAGGAWTFKPTNAEARVTETADSDYSSYGWWLRTKADGSLTASAFVDDRGTAPTTDITALVAGSATYRGGAAGKYALSSVTGGTNDAGHFTARATLEADFGKDEVTGTIDQFMADGESKDWTVELKKSALFNDGTVIGDRTRTGIDTAAATADDVAQKTVWTIGETAAAASGEWSGALKDTANTKTDTTGVPKVGTGTFYTEYGTAGRMVGAFGVKKQ